MRKVFNFNLITNESATNNSNPFDFSSQLGKKVDYRKKTLPLADLFNNSQESRRVSTFTIRNFGKKIKLAKVSYGNRPIGIYRQGRRSRQEFLHSSKFEPELWKIYQELKINGNFLASKRNFQEKVEMNFTWEEFLNSLLITLTFNNQKNEMKFWRAPWSDKKCFFGERCNN